MYEEMGMVEDWSICHHNPLMLYMYKYGLEIDVTHDTIIGVIQVYCLPPPACLALGPKIHDDNL